MYYTQDTYCWLYNNHCVTVPVVADPCMVKAGNVTVYGSAATVEFTGIGDDIIRFACRQNGVRLPRARCK